MWQTLERKAAFINQVATGRATDREVDDIGDQALSYAEVKALATGNPLILEKAAVDTEASRLGRLRRAHLDDQHRLRGALDAAERRARTAAERIAALEAAISRRLDTRGERFGMTVGDTRHTKRAEAGGHLHAALSARLAATGAGGVDSGPIGTLAGLELHGGVDRRDDDEVSLALPQAGVVLAYSAQEWAGIEPAGLVGRLERRIQGLEGVLADARAEQGAATAEAERARARIGAPFAYDEALRRLAHRQAEITEALLPGPEPVSGEAVSADSSAPERMAARLAALGRREEGHPPPSLAR